jgi:hypothetical protein
MNHSAAASTQQKPHSRARCHAEISLFPFLISVALFLTACASKTTQQGGGVFLKPPDANQIQASQGGAIYFTGDVRMNSVPWHEGLTLAEAIVQAQYTGRSDPFSISVTRNGTAFRVDVRRLLRGEENPPLEPGDRINVRR